MTLPHERAQAVLLMAERVMALAPYLHGKSETVRVPREMLRELHRTLRHFPARLDMERVGDVFGRP